MIETEQKTIKENKMKDCVKKCVMVLAVLAIVIGFVAITGCGEKKCTKAPATTTVEKTTKTTCEKTTKK
jgi:hypothetical protein